MNNLYEMENLDLSLEEPAFLADLWSEQMPEANSPGCCASTASTAATSCIPSCLASLSSAC